ncbi:hypothetical protein [Streptomyces sp. NPDC056361]|uniref:hypothetical protein n=1 Tax=Streptomyces sp. NPDC056361 TaxID=3345795 RepID=UPI0035E0403F
MPSKFVLALRLYAIPVLGSFALALHHKTKTGSWTFPVYFTIPTLAWATYAFWHNSSPERVARLQARKADRRAAKLRG